MTGWRHHGLGELASADTRVSSMRLAVGIATRGREFIAAETIADLQTQKRQPDSIVVAYADASDVGDAPQRFPNVRFLKQTRPYATAQYYSGCDGE